MKLSRVDELDSVLIVSITPYFLEKGVVWFRENLNKILSARKTQSFFEDNTLYIERDQKYNLSQFLRKLDEMGYERVWQVSEPGEFSQRGGIVDVFPINSNQAIRFDFLGNKIEEISALPIKIEDELIAKEILKKKLKSQKLFSDLKGLKPGDYLVHLDHGVGKFIGLSTLIFQGRTLESYGLEYAQGDKLFVPVGLERKLSRYIGFVEPKISRLGSQIWQRTKRKIKEETEKLAKELLEIYAQREITTRPPYLPEDEIDFQLASGFRYEETPDQVETIEEIKKDLETNQPMDRIVCGDVGFGKTEVALRAMIKAVKSGYQTAMICPTTILSNQHFQNFKQRLRKLPIKIAILSRLQSKREQKEIIENLKMGKIDIVVGTHRLLSKDVEFEKLGLLIIDDEQKFGVSHKEKLRQQNPALDILYLSATPIPRTIYLALSSLKQVSFVLTPPEGRRAIKTFVLAFDKEQIKKAITQELAKKGQIYFLHNRIETMANVKAYLDELKTTAKIAILHSKLSEKEITQIMADFQNKKIDVLLSTTIIENGLDIANANTLIVNDATRLGLSQAYQLRGRIGRSKEQAFAYFFYPKGKLRGLAKQRLVALKNAQELGSGYKIAMQDMEIRGAGNILGKEQSGSVNKVGLNLYCQMLSMAVDKLRQTSTLSELNEARHKNTRPENN